jgi:hypothetical protein
LTPHIHDPQLGPRVASLHRLLRSRALAPDEVSPRH